MSAGLMEDERRRQANKRAGHKLCDHCKGTGNELYAMYRACPECGGSGVAKRFGEQPALIRKLALRREQKIRQRAIRGPLDWRAEINCLLSSWLGIGHWFHDRRDRCRHCDATPSDIDFDLRRVGPLRAECRDQEACRETQAIEAALNTQEGSGG